MKKQRWAVPADRKIAGIIDFIRKYLKLEPTESLVNITYVNKYLYIYFEYNGSVKIGSITVTLHAV